MAGEFIEFFNELLFGSGAWIGLILILSIALLVSYKAKYSSIIFMMILIMLNWEYWGEVGDKILESSVFMWSIIISYMGIIILGAILLRDLGIVGKK